jgi:hypothetical protein
MTEQKPRHLHDIIQDGKLDAKAEYILNQLTPAPEERSDVLKLLDEVIGRRSEKWVHEMRQKLSEAGMVEDLRQVSKTMTYKAIISSFTEFYRVEGRFPEMGLHASPHEFMLAAWAYLFMSGPDPFVK